MRRMERQPGDETDGRPRVAFVRSKFGTDLPIIDGFLFYAKDTARPRFSRLTMSCCASLRVSPGRHGTFYVDRSPSTIQPDHGDCITALRRVQQLCEEAQAKENRHVQTVMVCSDVLIETKTTRRQSVDNRLVRQYRKRGNAPAMPCEIETFPFLERNAMYVRPDKSVVVFCKEWGVRVASSVKRICVDDTFRSAPKTHYQLLTFHATCSNRSSFPVVHALMSDKRRESYLVILRRLRQARKRLVLERCSGEMTSLSRSTSKVLRSRPSGSSTSPCMVTIFTSVRLCGGL